MDIIGIKHLEKLKRKNKGNNLLINAIDVLITDLEINNWRTKTEILLVRPDADCVHSDGFYFFDINIHRTLILIAFGDDGEATIVWCGSHDEYENTFGNSKNTIRKWLKLKELID